MVRSLGDHVLVSETGTATVYQWSTRAPLRTFWTDAMYYGCAIGEMGARTVLVAFGDLGGCAWDIATGALLWRRADLGTSSDVVLIPRPDGVAVGATRVEKFGGPRLLLDLATGGDAPIPKRATRKGRHLASDLEQRRYAIFDGSRVVICTDDDSEVATLSWKAHVDDVTVERHPGGMVVTKQRFGDNEGLFAFGGEGFLAIDIPDVIQCDRAGDVVSTWRCPDTERVVDVAHHAGAWYLLMRRWPTDERVGLGEYDVRVLERRLPARVLLSNCDGLAFVRGHALTATLELIPLDSHGTSGRLGELPPGAIQQAVDHPQPWEKRGLGWRGDWSRDPTDTRPQERRAAVVREQLAAPPDASDAGVHALVAGPIAVDPELGRALVAMRMLGGGDTPPEVTLAALVAAEQGLGWPMPEAVVTLLASRVPYLEREWHLHAPELARNHERGRATVPLGLRPFAFAKGRKSWLCVRGDRVDAPLYLFNERGRQSVGPFRLVEWVTRELSHLREGVRRRWLDGDAEAKDLLRRERALRETTFTPAVVSGSDLLDLR